MASPSYLPMAQSPSSPQAGNPVAVVGPQFCDPYLVNLSVVRKPLKITEGNFVVTDVNGNIVFKIKSKFSLHEPRVLVDAAGNPILTVQQKILSAHSRWKAFRGESTDPKDLLFSAKKSSLIQVKTVLDVFLAQNTKEDVCDFKVKGNWLQTSCTIYLGQSSNIIAQMQKEKLSVKSTLLGKDNFGVTVYPDVDYAFIVALVVILDGINQAENGY